MAYSNHYLKKKKRKDKKREKNLYLAYVEFGVCSKLLMELLSILWVLQLLVCFEKLTPLYCL